MRKTLEIGCGLGFLLTLLLTVAIHGTAAQVRQDTLRLHVVANSDTWEDQLCKLAVRDAVLQTAADALQDCETSEQAEARLRALLPALEQTARLTAKGQNVTVQLQKQDFTAREYGRFSLPEGAYTALRVTLGAGEGRNWFCVLYPALCVSASEARYPGRAENALVFGKYELRSALWDALTAS